MLDNQEIERIKAYINKPQSEQFYIDAFEAYTAGGVEQFKWKWSWWAFGGGLFFLLYRKLYIEAAIFFLLSLVLSAFPIGYIIIWIVSGAVFPYLVFKRYQKAKEMVLDRFGEDEAQILSALREYGGYNQWAVYLSIFINLLILIWFVYMTILVTGASMGAMPMGVDMPI